MAHGPSNASFTLEEFKKGNGYIKSQTPYCVVEIWKGQQRLAIAAIKEKIVFDVMKKLEKATSYKEMDKIMQDTCTLHYWWAGGLFG